MRILLITHSLATGGTDRVAVHLANGFARKHETTLLSVRKATPSAGLEGLLEPAARAVSLDKQTGSRTRDMIAGFPALIGQVRRIRPDVVMATGNNNSLFAMLGHLCNPNPARRLSIKITNPIMREQDGRLVRSLRKALYGAVLGRCEHVLALSVGEAAEIAATFPRLKDRIGVVQNPYVTDAMLAISDARGAPQTSLCFVALGRLHHQKNYSLLLDAWALAGLTDAELKIAGDGPELDMLTAKARELDIEGSVRFLGYQADIAPLLKEARCLVLSSDYEGLPAVVLEAFAAGCPVISTDCFPAAKELVSTAPGCMVVPRRDPVALAKAIREIAARDPPAPAPLQERAWPYRIDQAIVSHLAAIGAEA